MGFDLEWLQIVDDTYTVDGRVHAKVTSVGEHYFSYNWSEYEKYFYIRDADGHKNEQVIQMLEKAMDKLKEEGVTMGVPHPTDANWYWGSKTIYDSTGFQTTVPLPDKERIGVFLFQLNQLKAACLNRDADTYFVAEFFKTDTMKDKTILHSKTHWLTIRQAQELEETKAKKTKSKEDTETQGEDAESEDTEADGASEAEAKVEKEDDTSETDAKVKDEDDTSEEDDDNEDVEAKAKKEDEEDTNESDDTSIVTYIRLDGGNFCVNSWTSCMYVYARVYTQDPERAKKWLNLAFQFADAPVRIQQTVSFGVMEPDNAS